ncbi:MAG: NAD(P)-dependent oxidoreductase [Thiotrichales bacterium]|nr:NAD(P)-dependent oxidoreductase [Thiotrichales bacterium]MCY4348782.1 NAD(P)-dependent oxidoreductase [Thiotrichales bacterium]
MSDSAHVASKVGLGVGPDVEPGKVAFLGLGVMGYHMAGHLAKAGHDVTVYNRTASKAERWTGEFAGAQAATPAAAAAGSEIVFACVGNDDDVRSVTVGPDGAFEGMSPGAIFVDHTTASADVARELAAAAAERDLGFMDAPVSGGEAGAVNGVLTVMVGGEQDAFDRCCGVIDAYARAVTLLGPVGAGQLTKMANQICIAGVVQGLSEALNLAERSGLDAKLVLDVISKGAAQSWQMENRGATMVDDEFDFGFAVDWMRKDLDICLAQGHRVGALLPLTALVNEFYARVQARGGGRWDTSSLMRLLTHP